MVAVAYGDPDVNGADVGAALLNIDALHTGIAGGYLSGDLRHDAFAALHVDAQHGLKFVFNVGCPTRWRNFVRAATTHFLEVFAGLNMDDKALARRHVANNMIPRYRATAAAVADHQAFAPCDGHRSGTFYGDGLVIGVVGEK